MRGVEVELGGKSRRIRYDFNAIADVEEKAAAGVVALFSEDRVGLHAMRILLWGGLKHEDKGLTIARVGSMIQEYMEAGGDLQELMDQVGQALQKSGLVGNVTAGEETDEG